MQINKPVILCVDDERSVLISLKEQLKSEFSDHYRYETASNAKEALEIMDELITDGTKVVLIFSDWLMPGMKGDEFLCQVHQKYAETLTVLLTGEALKEAVENAKRNANLLACIYKPWNLNDLVKVVHQAENAHE